MSNTRRVLVRSLGPWIAALVNTLLFHAYGAGFPWYLWGFALVWTAFMVYLAGKETI